MSASPELVAWAAAALRNIYAAADGSVPPSALMAALSQILWQMHNEEALQWGQNAYRLGGDEHDVEESWKRGFADSLGWSDEMFNDFWNNYEIGRAHV